MFQGIPAQDTLQFHTGSVAVLKHIAACLTFTIICFEVTKAVSCALIGTLTSAWPGFPALLNTLTHILFISKENWNPDPVNQLHYRMRH